MAVALHDRRHNDTFTFHSTWRTNTLSIVKVLILATVLNHCQERRVSLTRAQSAQADAMIVRSDNDAANALLVWVGVANVRRIAGRYGLTSTVIRSGILQGESDWWGYSTTTARDQLHLLTAVMHGDSVLTAANRTYLIGLMSRITPAQRWGVCTPPLPAGVRWSTKNGWGARADSYLANSIGRIVGNGRDYDAVILSRSPFRGDYTTARSYAADTASGVSRILYAALAHPIG